MGNTNSDESESHEEDASVSEGVPFPPGNSLPNRRLKRSLPSEYSASSSGGKSMEVEDLPLQEGLSLRDFEVLRTLGKGSQGTVFLVVHKEMNTMYALKTLRKSDILRRNQIATTLNELSVLKQLHADGNRCPFIVPLRFAFHSNNRIHFIFDFCGGGELYFHLGRRGRIPESLTRFYASEIGFALGYLHALGICYKDLKPENLMLDVFGHINLIDFGLSSQNIRSSLQGVTSTNGTIEYLPPEILSGKGGGLSIDWWAFGMVIYEMLVGVPPWYHTDREKVAYGIVNLPLQFPAEIDLSRDAISLITSLLSKDPTTRLGTKNSGEVLMHPFFKGVEWLKVAKRAIEPPFIPPQVEQNSVEVIPGLCNFDVQYTSIRVAPIPAKDFMPPQPNDPFDGFYFDWRLQEVKKE